MSIIVNMDELLDINHHRKTWLRVKEIEFSNGLIEGLTAHNSKIAIAQLIDFENGINTTTRGLRTPASLLRLRNCYKTLSKHIGKKDIDKISQVELTKIIKKVNKEHFARNIKVIFNWLERTKRIKENPTKHIIADEFSKGKPAWVYLGEEKMKLLLNSLGAKHKALAYLIYDSGVRPEEAFKLRVYDLQDDFKSLEIVEKRQNGERIAKKNSFGRKVKLKLCTDLIKEFINTNNLKHNDLLFQITQNGFSKALRIQAKKLFGTDPTKARKSPNKITARDLRHNSACYWLKRYKTNKDLMYRFGWKSEDKVFYYTEFLDMRDTIDDEDMITNEDKTKLEKLELENKKHKEDIALLNKKFDDFLYKSIVGKVKLSSIDEDLLKEEIKKAFEKSIKAV